MVQVGDPIKAQREQIRKNTIVKNLSIYNTQKIPETSKNPIFEKKNVENLFFWKSFCHVFHDDLLDRKQNIQIEKEYLECLPMTFYLYKQTFNKLKLFDI